MKKIIEKFEKKLAAFSKSTWLYSSHAAPFPRQYCVPPPQTNTRGPVFSKSPGHIFIGIAGISNNLMERMTANTKKWLHKRHHSQDPCWVHLSPEECTWKASQTNTPRQLDCLKKPGLLLEGFVTCQVSQWEQSTRIHTILQHKQLLRAAQVLTHDKIPHSSCRAVSKDSLHPLLPENLRRLRIKTSHTYQRTK